MKPTTLTAVLLASLVVASPASAQQRAAPQGRAQQRPPADVRSPDEIAASRTMRELSAVAKTFRENLSLAANPCAEEPWNRLSQAYLEATLDMRVALRDMTAQDAAFFAGTLYDAALAGVKRGCTERAREVHTLLRLHAYDKIGDLVREMASELVAEIRHRELLDVLRATGRVELHVQQPESEGR